ncbi:MAG TPA: hypothetical protein PKC11_12505, partial [Agitococcus sp.]|nr:hypothetical protein [Agitococcus sp.]
QSPLLLWIRKWVAQGHPVKLVFKKDAIAACSDENKLVLRELSKLKGVSFWQGEVNITMKKSHLCAEVMTARGSIFWAELTANISIPNNSWGNTSDSELWRSLPITATLDLEEIQWPILQRFSKN